MNNKKYIKNDIKTKIIKANKNLYSLYEYK